MQRARSISHVVKSLGATVWATIIFAAVAGCPWAMAAPTHPLDPLDEEELLAIRDILAHSGLFSANTNFAWIQLVEPAKKIVEDFRAGADFPRQASIAAIDYDQAKSFRVIIDLRANRIASVDELAALQPGLTERDSAIARDIVDRDPRIKEALTKRGFSIAAKVSDSVRLQYMAVGVDPSLDQEKNRLMRVLFGSDQEAASDTSPFVDGLMVIVDLYARKVIRFHDVAGVQGVRVPHDVFAARLRSSIVAAHPLVPAQPEGRNFSVVGHVVSWQNWRFRFSFNLREGLVLHQIGFDDSGRIRPILYRASVSEVLTGYGEPDQFWSWMLTLDEGIFGFGYLSMPAQAGQQVPANAVTLGAVMPDSTLPRFSQLFADRIYVYERDGGTLINYHERGPSVHARATELVIGSLVSLGNYVYGLNWVFKQDGSFAFEAELSGSIVTKFAIAKECETCAAIAQGPDSNGESHSYESSGSDKNGTLVYPNVIGINHQHWFNLRLDFDIDGTRNAVMENNVERTARPATNGTTLQASSSIAVVHTVLGSAVKAKRDMNHDTSRTWTIYNPSARNESSRPAGYTLMPMDNTATVLGRSLERGPLAFVFHHVWLTPQRDGQFYAAGASPNQAKSSYDDTLYSYADGSSVYDTDIVVWYSMGHTHLPRTEDFPLMTTRKLSVVFQPDGFFERNAVFDPPDAQIRQPGRIQQ